MLFRSPAIAAPPEETTTYVLDTVKQAVVHLEFSKDLNCHMPNSRKNRISSSDSSTANPVQSAATHETPRYNPTKERQHHSPGQSLISEKGNHHHHHQNEDGEGHSALSSSNPHYGSHLIKFHVILLVLTEFLCPMLFRHNILHA